MTTKSREKTGRKRRRMTRLQRERQLRMRLLMCCGVVLVLSGLFAAPEIRVALRQIQVQQGIAKEQDADRPQSVPERQAAKGETEGQEEASATVKDNGILVGENAVVEPEVVREKKTIYLTFDDGPSMDVTPEILDILKANDVKAIFFILNYGEKSIPILKRMVREGHTIGIHGYSHDYAEIYTSEEAFMDNVQKLHDKLLADVGYDARIVRFPGGSSNTISEKYKKGIMTKLTKRLEKEGWKYLDWNVSTGDAEGNNIPSSQLVKAVKKELKPEQANVILLHDTSAKQSSADALQDIIDFGFENGYTFCPVTEDTTMVHHRVNN